jgi:hypothetical protein
MYKNKNSATITQVVDSSLYTDVAYDSGELTCDLKLMLGRHIVLIGVSVDEATRCTPLQRMHTIGRRFPCVPARHHCPHMDHNNS